MFDEYQLGLFEGKMNERDRVVALLISTRDFWQTGASEYSVSSSLSQKVDVYNEIIELVKEDKSV